LFIIGCYRHEHAAASCRQYTLRAPISPRHSSTEADLKSRDQTFNKAASPITDHA